LNSASIELGLGHVSLVRMDARRTYSLAYNYPTFMGRIHAILRYYLLPTDLDVDVKSVETSSEVGSNLVIDDEKITL